MLHTANLDETLNALSFYHVLVHICSVLHRALWYRIFQKKVCFSKIGRQTAGKPHIPAVSHGISQLPEFRAKRGRDSSSSQHLLRRFAQVDVRRRAQKHTVGGKKPPPPGKGWHGATLGKLSKECRFKLKFMRTGKERK